MTETNLIEKAEKIIHLEYPTRRDMVELSRIEFDMAKEASKASRLASQEEEMYNLKKSKVALEEKSRKRSMTEATEVGKYVAEQEHGGYRSMKETAKTMWNTIESIRGFKISVYSAERENDEVTASNFKGVDIKGLD